MKEHIGTESLIVPVALSYRQPMTVNEIHLFWDGTAYPVCPRCHITIERDYQAYCDRCGQALNWKAYHKAIVVIINR